MTLFDGWFVKKANPDAERNHLNKILQAIKTALEGAVAGSVSSVQPGTGIDVDATDPNNPVVSVEASIISGAGLGATALQPGDNVSELVNDAGYVNDLGDLGITASAAEINVLDGITATTTELNYTDGVTSSIQTQLDSKQATLTNSTSNTIVGTQVQRAALTGDVTASANSNATTIANDAVTNAKAANMAQSTIKGRASGAGTGDPTDLTPTQVRTIINVADGATANTGTVTSVAVANATGITWVGSPITTSGTFTPTLSTNLQAWSGLATSSKQDADSTLTALAGADWVANAFPVGTGVDTVAQVSFAANTFPARASVGDLVANAITDASILVLGGAAGSDQFLRGDGVASADLVNPAGGMMIGASAFGGAGGLNCTRTNGTVGLPTAVVNNNNLNILGARGYDGTITTTTDRAALIAYATGNWTSTSHPTGYRIDLTASGATASSTIVRVLTTALRPAVDNAISCGASGFRFSEYWGAIGAINTSDARIKTEVRPFTQNELAAARALAEEIGFFKFLKSVEDKGASAREHCGQTVQRAIEIMKHHNLDPFNYGFICYDEWDEEPETLDEGGNIVCPAKAAGDMYSFRPDQLDRFITKGLHERIKALENKE